MSYRPLPALRALAVAAMLAATSAAAQQPPPDTSTVRDDLVAVLATGLYPVQFMAYCHEVVVEDPHFRTVGAAWTERNDGLWQNVVARAKAAGIDDVERAALDEATLTRIKTMIGSQGDKAAFCRFIASVIEGGYYDLNQREDLQAALKRIFPQK